LSAVRADGAVTGALDTAREYAAAALRSLDSLPDNDGSEWLRSAVDQLFARVNSFSTK
ncbi:MAG: hypothetical protein QOC92_4505, partial [Acidimicrobiaceae bacterium]